MDVAALPLRGCCQQGGVAAATRFWLPRKFPPKVGMAPKRLAVGFLFVAAVAGLQFYFGWKVNGIEWIDDTLMLSLCAAGALWLILLVCHRRKYWYNGGVDTPVWLSWRRVVGAHASFFYPRLGGCYCCRMPWSVTKHHVIWMPELFGEKNTTIWALCEVCHKRLPVDEKMRFYARMLADMVASGATTTTPEWDKVKESVMNDSLDGELVS